MLGRNRCRRRLREVGGEVAEQAGAADPQVLAAGVQFEYVGQVPVCAALWILLVNTSSGVNASILTVIPVLVLNVGGDLFQGGDVGVLEGPHCHRLIGRVGVVVVAARGHAERQRRGGDAGEHPAAGRR